VTASLFCEAADGEGDGQADDDHVDDEAWELFMEGVRACGGRNADKRKEPV